MASQTLQEARRLCDQGKYTEAARVLEAALDTDRHNIDLIVELGETWFTLGYYKRAAQVLGDGLDHSDELNNSTVAAGIMIYYVSRVYSTCKFKDSLLRAEKIHKTFRNPNEVETVNDATVRIDAYRCKLWQLANRCGGQDWSHVQEACVPALKRQFNHLMRKADFANCLILAQAYSTCGHGPEFSAPAIILATDERLPSHYRARAEKLIAQTLSDLDCRDQQRQHYENARKAFEDMNHRHGALDIKIAQLCQDALNPDQRNVVENINELFDTYKSLDFPNGLSAAYFELLKLANDLRDGHLQAEIIARCSTLSRLKLSASDDGKVISGATALWHDLAGSDCSLLRGLVAETVYRAYTALKHSEMSTIWAKRARVDLAGTSEATLIPLVEGTELEELNDLRNSYADVLQPHNHDIAGVPSEKRIERLEEFAYRLISIRGLGSETSNLMAHALEMLENDIRLLEDPTLVCLKSAKYQEIKASWLFKQSPARQDVELEMEAINQFNMAKKTYLEQKRVDLAALLLQRQALIYFGVFQKFERWKHPDEQHVLGTALNLYKVTLDSAVGLGLKFMIRENAYWVALCLYEQWKKGKCSSENVLGSLLSAEGHADQHRNELSILQGMETVVTKRQLSSEKHVRDIYRFAIQVCRSSGKWEDAWKWVQKSKARSLSDILGLGVLLPRAMVDEIEEQEVTSRLYVDECKLLERLSNASSSEKFQTRIQLDRHQDQMREHRCLQEVLNLREGASVNLRDLQGISKLGTNHEARPKIFVDWIITEHNILVSVISTTGQVIFNSLDITLQQIEAWVAEHMSGQGNPKASSETKISLQGLKEDDDSDKGPLRDLDALIRPLIELSDPDDLIVLCPSGPLHSLPLHALRLLDQDGERVPLLMRNPVVYCASLTSFAQCCRRAAEREHREPEFSSSFIAAYEPEAVNDDNVISGFDLDEREKLYSSNKLLATDFNAEGYCGEESTTAVLKACLERSHMVQFLGHCDIKGKNLIDQSLRLYSTSDGPASCTVQDLFDLRIRTSHISLLACDSLQQHFQAGDEPLGLATALLSAGAASVLGNLWPVETRTARAFSEHFYGYLKQMRCESDGHGVYDLAYAVREAVLDVRQCWDMRQPFHWASFVLHGAWFLNGSL